jgi:hypothetical protein
LPAADPLVLEACGGRDDDRAIDGTGWATAAFVAAPRWAMVVMEM